MAKTANDNAAHVKFTNGSRPTIDCGHLAKHIAPLFDGKAVGELFAHAASIHIEGNLSILFHTRYNAGEKVFVTVSALDVPFRYRNYIPSIDLEISVNATRPLDALVKDIRKRLLAPAAPKIEAQRAKVKELDGRRDNLLALADTLEQIAGDKVRVTRTESASDFNVSGRGDSYFQGRLNACGSLYVDRLTIPASKVEQFIKLLVED